MGLADRVQAGKLSVVATPIGNLEDVTLRALRVLREVDFICAEDTRRTAQLCRHHGIGTPLRSLHAHSSAASIAALVERLRAGARLALVSDAGTPIVSDPGAELVRAAIAAGIEVEAIPGPSAPIAALVSSGLSAPSFQFVGFLPRAGGKRARAVARIARYPGATILFEAPARLADTLGDLEAALGPEREAAVCRELTKVHEEIVRGPLAALRARFAPGTRGEITVVLAAPAHELEEEPDPVDDATIRRWLDAERLGTRQAADRLALLAGIPRRDAYRRVLALAAPGDGASRSIMAEGKGPRSTRRA